VRPGIELDARRLADIVERHDFVFRILVVRGVITQAIQLIQRSRHGPVPEILPGDLSLSNNLGLGTVELFSR